MWLATLHIPRLEELVVEEPQPAPQAPGLQQLLWWGLTVMEEAAREVEQEAAAGEEE